MRIAFAAILLGMGEHEVAVGFDSIRRDSSINLVLNVNATKHQLKSAPAWRWDTTKSSVDTRGECPSELSSFDVKQLCRLAYRPGRLRSAASENCTFRHTVIAAPNLRVRTHWGDSGCQ